MARSPSLYVFAASHAVKVGITRSDPERRRESLEAAGGHRVSIIAVYPCGDRNPWLVEREVQESLAHARTYGEWFTCTADEAVAAVEAVLARRPLPYMEATTVEVEPSLLADEVERRVRDDGERPELAALSVLGGRATSRQIASVLYGEPPEFSATLSIGRRMYGLQNRGYLTRRADEWLLTGEAAP